MNKIALIAALSAIGILFFFLPIGPGPGKYSPLSGAVYTAEGSTSTVQLATRKTSVGVGVGTTDYAVILVKGDDAPIVEVVSDLPLPPKFTAIVSTAAKYAVVNKASLEKKDPPRKTSAKKPRPAPPPAPPKPPAPKEPEKKEEPVPENYATISDHISNSKNSFYFTEISDTIKGVTITLNSITPYRRKDVLKFTITNDQTDYFFILGMTVSRGGQAVQADFFRQKQMCPPGKSIECLAVIPRFSHTELVLTVKESGQKERTFRIKFQTT